jgi:hypothetical protein
MSLNVKTPASIFRVLTSEKIPLDLSRILRRNWGVGNMVSDHESWQQKHRPTILTSPISWGELQLGEELQAIFCTL